MYPDPFFIVELRKNYLSPKLSRQNQKFFKSLGRLETRINFATLVQVIWKSVGTTLLLPILLASLNAWPLIAQENPHAEMIQLLSGNHPSLTPLDPGPWSWAVRTRVNKKLNTKVSLKLEDFEVTPGLIEASPPLEAELTDLFRLYRKYRNLHPDSNWYANEITKKAYDIRKRISKEGVKEVQPEQEKAPKLPPLQCEPDSNLFAIRTILRSPTARALLQAPEPSSHAEILSREEAELGDYNSRGMAAWSFNYVDQETGRIVETPAYKELIIHHSDTDEDELPEEIWKIHRRENGWDDVGYHIIIAQHPRTKRWAAFQARLPKYRGAHAGKSIPGKPSPNSGRFGVMVMGNFEDETPPIEALNILKAVTRDLCDENSEYCQNWEEQGVIIRIEKVSGHNDCKTTACPGEHMHPAVDVLDELYGSQSRGLLEYLKEASGPG